MNYKIHVKWIKLLTRQLEVVQYAPHPRTQGSPHITTVVLGLWKQRKGKEKESTNMDITLDNLQYNGTQEGKCLEEQAHVPH